MKILIYFIIISASLLWVTNYAFATQDEPKLIINEVMPNPIGDDSKLEWIEIKNTSTESVNLNKWTFNGIGLPDIEINPNEILILTRDRNSHNISNKMVNFTFNLINSGATITLKEKETSIENVFSYVESIEGRSFELLSGECSRISIHNSSHTMGLENTSCEAQTSPTTTPFPTVLYFTTYKSKDVSITAVSPYPSQGSEWIELTNNLNSEINFAGWVLKDESNKAYKLPEFILNSNNKTRIFPSTISLNNDGDTIYLYDSHSNLIDSLSYEKVVKDQVVSIEDAGSSGDKDQSSIDSNNDVLAIPEVKSINIETNEKSIYDILKKPIYYKVEDYDMLY